MKSEKGQALPLAIIVLALGALLIAPFLGHASSSLIGSRTYASTIDYRNACDAGVEHAIWSLAYNNLGATIPNVGDNITYQLSEAINGVIPSITVTTNATGVGAGSTGNITGKIDTYEFDTSNCYEPDMIHISGSVYAIVYRGPSNKGYLRTFNIAADGDITNTIISTLIYDTSTGYTPSIIHVSGTVYAIAYRGSSSSGYLKTVNIADNGIISAAVIDTLNFDSSAGYEPTIIQISGSVYAIAYRSSSYRGYLMTVTIAANGDIGDSIIDTLIFDSSRGYEPAIIQISGSVYAIAYRGQSNRGTLKTVTIAANGDIGSSIISSLVYDTANSPMPDIINISGNVYAILYTGGSNYGCLKTITIAANGTISPTIIATLNFMTQLYTPRIIPITGNVYLASGRGITNNGVLRTIEIAANGSITNGNVSSFEFDSSAYEPDIIQVSSGVFAIAYRGSGNDGFVVTVGITATTGANTYTIVASAGNTSIQAYVSTNTTSTTILSWQLQ